MHCQKFVGDIGKIGCIVDHYDPCVANKYINKKQHALTWNADDVTASHADKKVNDNFARWCDKMHGDEELGHVKVHRGKKQDCLGMTLGCTQDKALKFDVTECADQSETDFPCDLKKDSKP